MGENTLSASDVAMLNRSNDGWGENGFMWIFALLILFWGGNGAWGNNGRNNDAVTEAGLCNAMNFNDLANSVGRLADTVQQNQMSLSRDLCTGFSAISNEIDQARYDALQNSAHTQQSIDGVNFNLAQSTAAINATTTASMQKILDKMCADQQAQQQARIQQLELNQALAGVVRYPNVMAYNAGVSPFCSCNNCCG